MAGKNFVISQRIRGVWNYDEFTRVRRSPEVVAMLNARGSEWVGRLNAELHAAQKKREQPVEDGYTYHVNEVGNRARMYVVAFTARAQAHEKKHSSILKLMETTDYDVERRELD